MVASISGTSARKYVVAKIANSRCTNEGRFDLVAGRFDAGIHLGEFIERDMIAVTVSPDQRAAIVGSPRYFESHAKPDSPHDLLPLLGGTALGRGLVSGQDLRGLVVTGVVISHELWQQRFQGDANIIGRHFIVNNFDVQIVGVTRPGLRVYCLRSTTWKSVSTSGFR